MTDAPFANDLSGVEKATPELLDALRSKGFAVVIADQIRKICAILTCGAQRPT